MKRFLSALMLFALLACCMGLTPQIARAASLPELPYGDNALYINNMKADYIRPQCGPGDCYAVFASMNGKKHLYNPQEITRADAYFTVGNWVYVGFGYSDGKWRYGFFRKSAFTPYDGWDSIPEYWLDDVRYGTVTESVVPYNAPCWDGGDYPSCKLHRGDEVEACLTSDGWYLCRFYNDHSNHYGYVYLWVPGYAIHWY